MKTQEKQGIEYGKITRSSWAIESEQGSIMAGNRVLKATTNHNQLDDVRKQNLVAGVVVGLLLAIGGFYLLYTNEMEAGKKATGLAGAISNIRWADVDSVDPANDGHLIYLTGDLDSKSSFSDKIFGVNVNNALSLIRVATSYQWRQLKRSVKRGPRFFTEYEYIKIWSFRDQHSETFEKPGHDNPDTTKYKNRRWDSESLTLSAYTIHPSRIRKTIDTLKFTPLPLSEAKSIPDEGIVTSKGILYGRGSSSAPIIGDLRVTHKILSGKQTISICGRQNGNQIEPYECKDGTSIFEVREGEHTPSEILGEDLKNAKGNLWEYRIAGSILSFLGVSFFLVGLSYGKKED